MKNDVRMQILEELSDHLLSVDVAQLDTMIDYIEGAKRVFFYARGREMMMLSAFAMRVYHMGYDAYVVGEPHVPPIGKGDVLIVSIGMGTSPRMATALAQIEVAHQAGATLVALSAHPETVPACFAHVVKIPGQTMLETPEHMISVQTMGAPYEQAELVTLDYTVLRMMQRHGWQDADLAARHTNLE